MGRYLGCFARITRPPFSLSPPARWAATILSICCCGTLGLAGGVDGFMVLQRVPVGNAATLYVAGRDMRRLASTRLLGIATGRDGGSRERPRLTRLAPEQRRVVDALRDGAKSIRELAEAF